jgi:hypothetical protein
MELQTPRIKSQCGEQRAPGMHLHLNATTSQARPVSWQGKATPAPAAVGQSTGRSSTLAPSPSSLGFHRPPRARGSCWASSDEFCPIAASPLARSKRHGVLFHWKVEGVGGTAAGGERISRFGWRLRYRSLLLHPLLHWPHALYRSGRANSNCGLPQGLPPLFAEAQRGT